MFDTEQKTSTKSYISYHLFSVLEFKLTVNELLFSATDVLHSVRIKFYVFWE